MAKKLYTVVHDPTGDQVIMNLTNKQLAASEARRLNEEAAVLDENGRPACAYRGEIPTFSVTESTLDGPPEPTDTVGITRPAEGDEPDSASPEPAEEEDPLVAQAYAAGGAFHHPRPRLSDEELKKRLGEDA